MSRYLFFLLIWAHPSSAQQTGSRSVALLHYALDSFSAGKVLLRNGTVTPQQLNYNVLTGEMIFIANGKYLALAAPQDVDTVFIGTRKFLPMENKFVEWLGGSAPALFKEFTCTIKEPGVDIGYGKSNTTASVALTNLIRSGGAYDLKLPDEFQIIPGQIFWVKKGDLLYKVSSTKQLANLYPAKKAWMNEWWKKANGQFTNASDVTALVLAMQTPM